MEELFQYLKDFTFLKKDDIEACINKTAKKSKISVESLSKSLINKIDNIIETAIARSKKRGKELKDYQEKAVRHMVKNRGMIAAFQVGTGKTLTAVVTSYVLLQISKLFGIDIKVLVVTPVSLQDNFKNEMRFYGIKPTSKDYIFYTYGKFRNDLKNEKLKCSNKLLIIDEAHNFRKDYRSQFSPWKKFYKDTGAEYAVKCASKAWKVLLLTATPMYNQSFDIVNLISMVHGVYPPFAEDPLFMNAQDFKDMFCNKVLFQESSKEEYPSRKDYLVKIEMTGQFLKDYEDVYNSVSEIIDRDKEAFYVKLRAASNNIRDCIKCDFALKIINNFAIKEKQRILIYSFFISNGVKLLVNKLKKDGIGFYEITGKTKKAERQRIVNRFNGKKGHKILFLTKAGGEGLDLKKVRHEILFEKQWNINGDEQVIGRGIRYRSHTSLPEKERNVSVWHIVGVHPSDLDFDNKLRVSFPDQMAKFNIIHYKDGTIHKIPKQNIAPSKVVDNRMEFMSIDSKMEFMSIDLHLMNTALSKQAFINTVTSKIKEIEIGKC